MSSAWRWPLAGFFLHCFDVSFPSYILSNFILVRMRLRKVREFLIFKVSFYKVFTDLACMCKRWLWDPINWILSSLEHVDRSEAREGGNFDGASVRLKNIGKDRTFIKLRKIVKNNCCFAFFDGAIVFSMSELFWRRISMCGIAEFIFSVLTSTILHFHRLGLEKI